MKIRNLLAQYCNLQPNHCVQEITVRFEKDEDIKIVTAETYVELFDYAVKLEADNKALKDRNNLLLRELKVVNKAIFRKHKRILAIKTFADAFAHMRYVFEGKF